MPWWRIGEDKEGCMMGEDKRLFRNALPGDAGASPEQTVWFKNQNSFEKEEILAMVDYKRTVLKITEDGAIQQEPVALILCVPGL